MTPRTPLFRRSSSSRHHRRFLARSDARPGPRTDTCALLSAPRSSPETGNLSQGARGSQPKDHARVRAVSTTPHPVTRVPLLRSMFRLRFAPGPHLRAPPPTERHPAPDPLPAESARARPLQRRSPAALAHPVTWGGRAPRSRRLCPIPRSQHRHPVAPARSSWWCPRRCNAGRAAGVYQHHAWSVVVWSRLR